MTRWKKDETEFTVKLSNDGRNSTICRVPKPIQDFLNNPTSIKFVIAEKMVRVENGDLT